MVDKKLKPDKESENRDDIIFLSEIITNFMCWQIWNQRFGKFRADREHIFNFAEVKRINISQAASILDYDLQNPIDLGINPY